MTSKTFFLLLISLLLLTPQFSGCLDLLDPFLNNDTIVYEAHPTSVQYTISYGYIVNVSGTGSSTVLCTQDLPELINGSISNLFITPIDTVQKTIAHNIMIEWNSTSKGDHSSTFEVTAQITANDFFITDLLGSSALTINEIQSTHPDIVEAYCNQQSYNGTIYIDPLNPTIQSIATSVKNSAGSENSFLIAKQLFEWLKNNTAYTIHPLQQEAQPTAVTLSEKEGDCDDLSFLYISLCRSLEIPARFIRGYLADIKGSTVHAVDHMWVEVFVGGRLGNDGWIPVECAGIGETCAEVHQNFGMEDAFHLRLFTDDGTNESLEISSSHISVHYEQGMTIDILGFAHITDYHVKKSQQLCIKQDSKRSYC